MAMRFNAKPGDIITVESTHRLNEPPIVKQGWTPLAVLTYAIPASHRNIDRPVRICFSCDMNNSNISATRFNKSAPQRNTI